MNSSVSRRYFSPLALGVAAIAVLLAVTAGCQQAGTEPTAEATRSESETIDEEPAAEATRSEPETVEEPADEAQLPKLLDLGATKCIPCKMMAPILDELRDEYAGRMEVEFIDVWQNPDAATPYGIEEIPTQIFFDASGKELTRHTGFMSKEDILKTWEEHGVDLDA
ncbi:MAG: thioredoxin family protein [Planctomycetota bacterium]